jgi:hypothetical protein
MALPTLPTVVKGYLCRHLTSHKRFCRQFTNSRGRSSRQNFCRQLMASPTHCVAKSRTYTGSLTFTDSEPFADSLDLRRQFGPFPTVRMLTKPFPGCFINHALSNSRSVGKTILQIVGCRYNLNILINTHHIDRAKSHGLT